MRCLIFVALTAFAVQQKADPEALALERINFYRKAAGLEPVANDPALGKGCALHAQYLVKNSNHPSVDGLGMHKEDPKLPLYSAEGAAAGEASVVFPTGDPVGAVDKWIASLFHRVPLLDPQLSKVGFGFAKGGKWGGYVVVDTIHGRCLNTAVRHADQHLRGTTDRVPSRLKNSESMPLLGRGLEKPSHGLESMLPRQLSEIRARRELAASFL